MFKIIKIGIIALVASFNGLSSVQADRLKDLTSIAGVRSNQLVGYGLVVGLAGTGDGNAALTQQSLQSMISQFGVVTSAANMNGKNAAAVIITAELPPFTKPGQKLDIVVSTVGQAKSLRGGTLLMTPLLGADGETYAVAQGNLMVGGLGVAGGDGSSLTVNVPTVGRIPGGASVEKMIETPFLDNSNILLNLHQGDFSTTNRVAEAINDVFGDGVAIPLDSTTVKVRAPIDPAQKVSFVSLLENVQVEPDRPRAKVVINARTGTIVIGGDVRVSAAAVTHGSLTVRVKEDVNVTQTQAMAVADGVAATVPGAAVETPDTTITAEEEIARTFVFDPGVELSSIVDALNAVGGTPSDLVAILEALREAGSLRAELIVI
ncbi:flagellar basal body P-ring protein FlgI [Candidatus Puniceispirillum sp.]|uniref:flagellar basal body P-ring protein FlgI n=1 Tax=Candidatus Puniceispirillum sp. TaxID=2026719 RepID=UPI001ECD5FCF|nr:flagellar basal body P-ring protein FlgI [Candidatus Puniceispirillum sp.]